MPTPEELFQQIQAKELEIKIAQAELLREQVGQLRTPVPGTGWWARLLENPQAAVSLMSACVSLLSVGVAFLAFWASIRNANTAAAAARETTEVNRRNNEEQQLGLALARTGDKDSPLARASGAGSLARIASRRQSDADTVENVLDQLNHALRSETDEVVLGAIVDAFLKVMDRNPDKALALVAFSNELFQERLIDAMVDYFATLGLGSSSEVTAEHWQRVAWATRLSPSVLKRLVSKQRYGEHYDNDWLRVSGMTVPPKEPSRDDAWKQLQIMALRLEQSRVLCRRLLLPKAGTSAEEKGSWEGLFLAGSDLRGTDLRGVNLNHAELEGAQLWHAQIDQTTKLAKADWWQADFSSEDGSKIDKRLLDELFKLHGGDAPKDVNEMHESVARYLKERSATP